MVEDYVLRLAVTRPAVLPLSLFIHFLPLVDVSVGNRGPITERRDPAGKLLCYRRGAVTSAGAAYGYRKRALSLLDVPRQQE